MNNLKTVLATALFGAFVTLAGSAPAEADCAKFQGNWICASAAQVQALATRKGRKFKGFRARKGKRIKTKCTPGHHYIRGGQWYRGRPYRCRSKRR